MSPEDKQLALHWYAVCGYNLSTIAQHFNMARDELASHLHNQGG